VFCRAFFFACAMSLLPAASPDAAEQIDVALKSNAMAPLIVRNDRGGRVGRRAEEVRKLREANRAVELRGRICLSSCTMYLALAQTCVSPATTFGFHGPSHYGQPLSPRDFEYWSQMIAAHYPARLKAWYLRKGRHRNSGYFRIKGSTLIAMGIKRCS